MKFKHLLILLLALPVVHASAEEYRGAITIYVENKSSLPNRIQVRDVEARYELSEDCRVAKGRARACDTEKKDRRQLSHENMACAAALALMEEPRCSIKDLIFDDWMDGGMQVKLKIHTGFEGYGLVGVRAVNNTESWTFKPGLRDGDTVGHQ